MVHNSKCWRSLNHYKSYRFCIVGFSTRQIRSLLFRASGSCTEFAPVAQFLSLESIYTLGSLSGRSSNGDHPYFVINGDLEKQIAVCVAWSGNWTIRFEPMSNGAYRLSGGLHDEGFPKQSPLVNLLVHHLLFWR